MLKFTNFIEIVCVLLSLVNLLFVFTVDLNALPCRPVRCRVLFEDQEPPSRLPTVTTVPDLADHPLGVYVCSVSNVKPRVSLNRLSSSFGFSHLQRIFPLHLFLSSASSSVTSATATSHCAHVPPFK